MGPTFYLTTTYALWSKAPVNASADFRRPRPEPRVKSSSISSSSQSRVSGMWQKNHTQPTAPARTHRTLSTKQRQLGTAARKQGGRVRLGREQGS